jgi:hypothetical protein
LSPEQQAHKTDAGESHLSHGILIL